MAIDMVTELAAKQHEIDRLLAALKNERDGALEEAAQLVEQAAGPLCGFGMIGGLKGDKAGEAKAYAIVEVLPLIADEIRTLKAVTANG